MLQTVLRRNSYHDSVFLLSVSEKLKAVAGVTRAIAAMGTDMNKTVLKETNMLDAESIAATPKDLVIALEVENADTVKRVLEELDAIVSSKGGSASRDVAYPTLELAAKADCGANLAFISLPGEFAAIEADKALDLGLSVFIFSDNVAIDDEVALKQKAVKKGLMVMGPGCGTAVIGGVSLGMMSAVASGPIGIVGASGSGIHQIVMHIDALGGGASQAIGTGGRDLSEAVGGITMLQGLDYLDNDPGTSVIILVSKPPAPNTMARVLERVASCAKPVIIYFLGGDAQLVEKAGAMPVQNLEDAARRAVGIALGREDPAGLPSVFRADLEPIAEMLRVKAGGPQKYLRGLFCGGTHAEESALILHAMGVPVHANLPLACCSQLESPEKSVEHSIIDMGDEVFTKGKPHPVIDPSIMKERIIIEGEKPETAVLLLDVLCGYGAHADPAGVLLPSLTQVKETARRQGRDLPIIVSLCGSDKDPQNVREQKRLLEKAGATVIRSNPRAAYLAGLVTP
jgi:succinyl-CoA synthetase alpha subunit